MMELSQISRDYQAVTLKPTVLFNTATVLGNLVITNGFQKPQNSSTQR